MTPDEFQQCIEIGNIGGMSRKTFRVMRLSTTCSLHSSSIEVQLTW